MNKLEFDEILKLVGINNPLTKTYERYGEPENVHYWNNYAIYFNGTYYTVIKGDFPLDFAKKIYDKYPNDKYLIRVNGGSRDWNFNNNYKIDTYHIDTKEGLLIFLLELKDYINKTDTETQKYNELYLELIKNLLCSVNPYITAYEWMQDDTLSKDKYNDALKRNTKSGIGSMIGDSINMFDSAVNPFLLDDISIDDLPKMLSTMEINVSKYDLEKSKGRKGCCAIEFKDIKTGCTTNYYRSCDGFSFQVNYKDPNGDYFSFLHYFTTKAEHEYDKGEFLAVNGCSNHKYWIDLRVNLTKWKAGKTYDEKKKVNPIQIVLINDALQNAIKLASDITLNSFKDKETTLTR